MKQHLSRILSAVVIALAAQHAFWPPTPTPPSRSPDKLAEARAQIDAKKWSGAIDELQARQRPGQRRLEQPDGLQPAQGARRPTRGAEKFYNEALRIDPNHRGALEYSGELYLMKGDLARAEERLAALDKACTLPLRGVHRPEEGDRSATRPTATSTSPTSDLTAPRRAARPSAKLAGFGARERVCVWPL